VYGISLKCRFPAQEVVGRGDALLCLIPRVGWAGTACKILSPAAERRYGVSYKEWKMPSSVLNTS